MANISRLCSSLVWWWGNKFSCSNITWKSKDNAINCAGSWHAGVAGLGSGANTSGFVANWLKCLMLMEVKVVVKCRIRTQSDESLQIWLRNSFDHFSDLDFFKADTSSGSPRLPGFFSSFLTLTFSIRRDLRSYAGRRRRRPVVTACGATAACWDLQSVWVGSSQKNLIALYILSICFLIPFFSQLETTQVTMSWCVSTLVLPMQHCQRVTTSTRCVGILFSTRGPPSVAFAVAFGSDSMSFWS